MQPGDCSAIERSAPRLQSHFNRASAWFGLPEGRAPRTEAIMNTSHARRYLIATTLLAATTAGALLTATSSSGSTPAHPRSTSTSRTWSPNDCIRLNGGDYNACNVGNSGRGDLPYSVHAR
jgi:hypothetical protein